MSGGSFKYTGPFKGSVKGSLGVPLWVDIKSQKRTTLQPMGRNDVES